MIVVALILGLFSRKAMKWYAMYIWSKFHLLIVGASVNVIGKEKLDRDNPAIYVANHSSHFDIPVLFNNIGFFLHFIAKIELKKIPLFGWGCTMVDIIWIDRKNKMKAQQSMMEAGEHIKKGLNVISFPEGTRSKTGEIGMFRKGSFLLAQQAGIDVVPLYLKGTRPLNPPGSFSFRPSKVTVMVGDRLNIADYADRRPEDFANEVQAIVKKMEASCA
jgi:1-acyl-sn-glycerol-3-phosphate acyltransferase